MARAWRLVLAAKAGITVGMTVFSYPTLSEWIATEAAPFSLDAPGSLDAAVDSVVAVLGESVEVLGLGEPTHGADVFLEFRNRLFERLVERHGFTAIALESSFPRAPVVNEYVAGRGPASYEELRERGFSHGFGASHANRELVEWMRRYNAEPLDRQKLAFYGCDSPTEIMYSDSPRVLLHFVLDYLALIDGAKVNARRARIDELLGADAAWENHEANLDSSKSIGRTPAARALGVQSQHLSAELRKRRNELIADSGLDRYLEAVHYAAAARQMLTYHAIVATPSDRRLADCLGQRDVMMADNLKYIAERVRRRGGKVLVFAHNGHLKLGRMHWQLGPQSLTWSPAGSHLRGMLGSHYAVIGMSVGRLTSHGLGAPEPDTLEALLTASGRSLVIPTHLGQGLPSAEIAALPARSTPHPGYFPFTAQSFSDFDALAMLGAAG
jgi:erythromycin esterase-like protein